MPRKFYTIFILPHAHSRFRKIHLSRNFIVAVSCMLALVLGAGAISPHLMMKMQAQSSALQFLQEENRKLREENVRFEASLSQIGEHINSVESVASRLAKAVGMKDLLIGRPAGGGLALRPESGSVQGMLEEELGSLRTRAQTLDHSMEQLSAAYESRLRLLASTPSLMPVLGLYSDGFGWRNDPFTGEREFHKGLDLVAPYGTLVHAAADGVVTRAGRMSGYGKMVHISHGFGHGTRYGHLSEILVHPGQRVHLGDAIGRVGSTGRSSGPHLHYEVFQGDRQVDPRKFLGSASL